LTQRLFEQKRIRVAPRKKQVLLTQRLFEQKQSGRHPTRQNAPEQPVCFIILQRKNCTNEKHHVIIPT